MKPINELVKERVDGVLSDGTDIVTNEDCHCGFGEPRGDQCDCPYEVHHRGYNAKEWLKSFHRATIIQLLENEVERLTKIYEEGEGGNHFPTEAGSVVKSIISYYQEQIEILKKA